MRDWRTTVEYVSGTGLKKSVCSSYKTYKLKEVGDIIRDARQKLVEENLPKRMLNPISAYVLDFLIDEHLARNAGTLEKITVEDSKENGL